MARIQIAKARSIDAAEISLAGPIVFLTGPNDGGKTTIARLVAGLTAGTGDIFEGTSKQIADKVIALGEKGAAAKLYDDQGSRTLRWSKSKGTHKPEEQGDVSGLPKGGMHAAALASFLTMAPKDRNAAFWEVISVNPSRSDCDDWLSSKDAPHLIDGHWQELQTIGFDAAAESWRKSATSMAGKWAGIAGEAFGPEKANGWQAKVETSDDAAAPDLDALQSEVDKAKTEFDAADGEFRALPASPNNPTHRLVCPCCEKSLMFTSGALKPYESMPEDQVREIRMKHAEVTGKQSNKRSALARAEHALIEVRTRTQGKKDDAAAKTKAAAECFSGWEKLNHLATMAGPKGVRMAVRDDVVDDLNVEIGKVAKSMGLDEAVEVVFENVAGTRDEVVNMQIGGIPYDSLSGNRQWRARAILQIVIAKRTGAGLVVMDEAEALDPYNRNALFLGLRDIGMIAIIATYSPSIDKAPDLAATGLGVTYWCEGGAVVPISQARTQTAKAA